MSPGHVGKPLSTYDIAWLVGKAFPLAFTPNSICKGFSSNSFPPLNENIYTDGGFIPASYSDRLPVEKSHIEIESMPFTQQTTSNFKVIHRKTPTLISMVMIRPHLKAEPLKGIHTNGKEKRKRKI